MPDQLGAPIVIQINEPQQQQIIDPCAVGIHRPAWLAAGGQACGLCGVRC